VDFVDYGVVLAVVCFFGCFDCYRITRFVVVCLKLEIWEGVPLRVSSVE